VIFLHRRLIQLKTAELVLEHFEGCASIGGVCCIFGAENIVKFKQFTGGRRQEMCRQNGRGAALTSSSWWCGLRKALSSSGNRAPCMVQVEDYDRPPPSKEGAASTGVWKMVRERGRVPTSHVQQISCFTIFLNQQ
jgi:hypothetical protein